MHVSFLMLACFSFESNLLRTRAPTPRDGLFMEGNTAGWLVVVVMMVGDGLASSNGFALVCASWSHMCDSEWFRFCVASQHSKTNYNLAF